MRSHQRADGGNFLRNKHKQKLPGTNAAKAVPLLNRKGRIISSEGSDTYNSAKIFFGMNQSKSFCNWGRFCKDF